MAPSYPIRTRKAVRYLGAQGSYALNRQLKKETANAQTLRG
jgi:hypothetical protein